MLPSGYGWWFAVIPKRAIRQSPLRSTSSVALEKKEETYMSITKDFG